MTSGSIQKSLLHSTKLNSLKKSEFSTVGNVSFKDELGEMGNMAETEVDHEILWHPIKLENAQLPPSTCMVL